VSERWWVDAEGRPRLLALAPFDVSAWMALAEEGERLSSDPSSAAVRLAGPDPLLLKWRRPRRGRRARTLLRASRERKEARAALRLLALGIAVPRPLAVAERRRRGVLAGSLLVRPFVDGACTAAQVLARDPSPLAALAVAWRRWHDLGFRHGDAYPKNVLVREEGEPMPIGFPMARVVTAGEQIDKERVRDLAQWVVGLEEVDLGTEVDAFLRRYGAGRPEASISLLADLVEERARGVRSKKALRLESRPVDEPLGPVLPRPLRAQAPSRLKVLDLAVLAPGPGL